MAITKKFPHGFPTRKLFLWLITNYHSYDKLNTKYG